MRYKLQNVLISLIVIGTVALPRFRSIASPPVVNSNFTLAIDSSSKQANEKSVIQEVRDIFTRKPQRAGTSGDEFCSISPNQNNGHFRTTWSLKPLFVWRGEVAKIKVFERGSSNPLWDYSLSESEQQRQQVLYGADTELQLEHEKHYELVFISENNQNIESVEFATVSDIQHRIIQAQLNALEQEVLESLGEDQGQSMTANELEQQQSIARAEFFDEQEDSWLWMDVMRELLLLELAEAETEVIQTEVENMCET